VTFARWPVADPIPRIISLLQTVRDARRSVPAEERDRAWLEIDAILAAWDERESVSELRTAFGLDTIRKGRRRRQSTVNRETEISLAIMTAALNGDDKPMQTARKKCDTDEREVQRAWKTWKFLYMRHLDALLEVEQFRVQAQRAIETLRRQ
jgi:hypothetical protein